MKRVLILIAGCLLLHISASAQAVDWDDNVPASWLRGATVKVDRPGVQGSPYIFDEWLKGSLIMTNGRLVEDITINFVNHTGNLFISKPYHGLDVEYRVIEQDVVSLTLAATANQEERHFIMAMADSIETELSGNFFYEVLVNGKITLLKKSLKEFVRARKNEAYSNGANEAKFVLRNQYFLRIGSDSPFTQVRLNKKLISATLSPEQRSLSKSLIKQHKWKWTREEDVVALLRELGK